MSKNSHEPFGEDDPPPRQPAAIFAIGTALIFFVFALALFRSEWLGAICALIAVVVISMVGRMVGDECPILAAH